MITSTLGDDFMKRLVLAAMFFCLGFIEAGMDRNAFGLDFTVRKIWDAAPHNAFTDLTFFNGAFYCTFREGTGHMPGKKAGEELGTIRVIRSKDGEHWESVALLEKAGYDLRDSKISVTPDKRLMLTMGGSVYGDDYRLLARHPHVSFSDKNGENFTLPDPIEIDASVKTEWDWLWRVTWHQGIVYGTIYREGGARGEGLFRSSDGKKFESVKEFDFPESWGNPDESTVRFDARGNMFILMRFHPGNNNGRFGMASPPYTDWTWKDTGKTLGGPEFCFLPSGKILVADRAYDANDLGTAVYKIDENGKLIEIARFPSSGDTGYPGIVVHEGFVWISYYSSHEGKTSVYLVKVPLDEVEKALTPGT